MANARRELSKLCAKCNSMSEVIQGSGHVGISQADVAFALATVKDPLSQLLLQAKWGEQVEVVPELKTLFASRVGRIAKAERWRSRKAGTIVLLAEAVVDEDLHPRRCHVCRGTGSALIDALLEPCPRCDGTGRLEWSDSKRASLMNIHVSSYQESWGTRWLDAQALLREAERRGVAAVSNALNNPS